jgi:hypothetical protein
MCAVRRPTPSPSPHTRYGHRRRRLIATGRSRELLSRPLPACYVTFQAVKKACTHTRGQFFRLSAIYSNSHEEFTTTTGLDRLLRPAEPPACLFSYLTFTHLLPSRRRARAIQQRHVARWGPGRSSFITDHTCLRQLVGREQASRAIFSSPPNRVSSE